MTQRILQNYHIKYTIGEGGFAQVFFAIHKLTGCEVAIKIISKKDNNKDGQQVARVHREIEILKKIKHPFITELFEVIENENNFFLVLEYAKNGTLLNSINERGPLKEADAAIIFAEIALVLRHIHVNCNIAHRDIKTDNILFDSNLNIRVIDFGLSNSPPADHKMHRQCGSPAYASPELLLGKEYTFASDIWSAGIVLYAMVTGYLPFEETSISKLAQKIVYTEVNYPSNISPLLKDLLTKLLQKDYRKRIAIDEILAHPWISQQVELIQKKLSEFKFDREILAHSLGMMGLNIDSIERDINDGIFNEATVSYNLIRRHYMNLHLQPANDCIAIKQTRSGSQQMLEATPRLHIKEYLQNMNRKTLPSNAAPLNKKRHCQSPVMYYPD